MMTQGALILVGAVLACLLLVAFGVWYYYRVKADVTDTQRKISDASLLKLIWDQPDGLLSPHQMAELIGISVNQARHRLHAFVHGGLLRTSYSKTGRHFYSLSRPFEAFPEVNLSSEPFLTVEDLLQLFEKDDDGQLTLQELIIATNLPLDIILREMKHFANEDILEELYTMDASMSAVRSKFYVLKQPYRSNHGEFRVKAGQLDLQMRELLRKDNLVP